MSLLVAVAVSFHGCLGCAGQAESDPIAALNSRFSAQVTTVLSGAPLVQAGGPYTGRAHHGLTPTQAAARAMARSGALAVSFPLEGEGEVRLSQPGGFSATVRDLGARGPGLLIGDAQTSLAFKRTDGMMLANALKVLTSSAPENFEALAARTSNDLDPTLASASDSRAKSVVDYLVEKGIEANRLIGIGYGRTRPLGTNKTEAGRKKNRRVQFEIMQS